MPPFIQLAEAMDSFMCLCVWLAEIGSLPVHPFLIFAMVFTFRYTVIRMIAP